MTTPPIPANEADRMKALYEYNILDSMPEGDFDEITNLASQICDTPISLVSLVDPGRQWFLSNHGLDVRETARELAFCAHAINSPDELFLIPDSRKDERFADNPLVVGKPNVIFYAGVPLVNPDGYALGTLCIIDNKPKELSPKEINALTVLSKQVVKLLELRKKNMELKENQSRLEKTVELFTQTSNVAKVGGWEADILNNKLAWTSVTKEIHEVPDDFIPDLPKAISFYKAGKNRDIIAGLVIDAIEKGKPFDEELEIVTAKGKVKWVRAKGETEFINGKCSRIYGILQDIHDEKMKDIQLAVNEEQMKLTFNHATIGMGIIAADKSWNKMNRSMCNIVGYEAQELTWEKFIDISNPYDLREELRKMDELVEGKIENFEMEKRFIHKKGNLVWTILSVSLVRDIKNNPLHFITQLLDITARKEAEQTIAEERRLLVTLIDNLPLNIFIKDLNSCKVLVNKKEVEHMGFESELDILGKTDYELYPVESAFTSIEEDQEVFTTGIPIIHKETFNFQNDGSATWFLTSKIPLRNADNEITGLLGISYDITDRKKTEEKLKGLVDVTTEQNARLLNFAHIVSHNLRSHSSNFAMLLELLEVEKVDAARAEMFEMLKKASGNLSETVANLNEIVAVSTTTKKEVSINLNKAIQNVQGNIQALLLESNVQVINEVDDSVNISAVPAYLDSILLNFLTNGIKYKSADKAPYVKFKALKKEKQLMLSIQDNGLGIDLEKNGEKIFGMYKTFHGNKDARGVGLFITKNQIEAMGGKIDVESKTGVGTTFNIYFNLN